VQLDCVDIRLQPRMLQSGGRARVTTSECERGAGVLLAHTPSVVRLGRKHPEDGVLEPAHHRFDERDSSLFYDGAR